MQLDKNIVTRKIQSLELGIALQVKSICEKYNIKYFLISGTTLGAIRHEGFIPWDDDMDIGMLRDDYNRFISICKDELPERYFLQTWDTDSEYPFSYAKIRLNGTRMVEKFSDGSKAHSGIFIDIFPYDNVPKSNMRKRIHAKKIFAYKRLLWVSKGYGKNINDSMLYKLKFSISKVVAMCFGFERLKTKMHTTLLKYNNEVSEQVFTDGSYSYEKETIERSWIDNTIYIDFEGEKLPVFEEYDIYLTHFYGDYMTPPPEDKRGGHEVVDVDFGEY